MGKRLGIVCNAVLIGLMSSVVSAQQSVPAYGVDSLSVDVVNPWEMELTTAGNDWVNLSNGYRYISSGPGGLIGVVDVPQGASILTLELEACDTSALGEVTVNLFRYSVGGSVVLAGAATGFVATQGCGRYSITPPTPETVDNVTYRYLVTAVNSPGDGSTSIGAIRIFYQRQVSPAPGSATFNDVPTSDPAFQYIEALVASGITAGCGSGSYCPDAPLTRRQMAVFIAKALGLHWPEFPVATVN